MAIQDVFAQLEYLGLFDVLLPFILVFTLVFAILQKVKLFVSSDKMNDSAALSKAKSFNAVIALVMGLAVVFPHVMGYYPPDQDIVLIINHALPNVSIVIVAIVMALLIIGIFGKRFGFGDSPGSLSGWLALIAFGLIIYIFGAAANWWSMPDWLNMLNDSDTMALVITILVFAIIIWFITKEDKPNNPQPRFGQRIATEFLSK